MATEYFEKLAAPDPELVELQKSAPALPTSYDIQFWKKMSLLGRDRTYAALGPTPEGVTEKDHEVKMRDGETITIRSHSPGQIPDGGSPLIVLFHGGGFCVGGLDNEQGIARDLALQLGAVVLNVEYRLAPEHPFPTPINDAWDSLKWAAENATFLKATPSKGFIVGGSSAGGNIASVLTHLARNQKLSPPLTGQFLAAPLLLPPEVVPEKYKSQYVSHEQNSKGTVLSTGMMDMFNSAHNADVNSPLYVAFNDPTGHNNLPPAYFQICGADMLRDDAIIYEKVLREEYGIATKVDIYAGLPHMFWAIYSTLSKAMKRQKDTVEGIRWLLAQN